MANPLNGTSEVRRIAVLLSSLPATEAEAVLAEFAEEQQQRLRAAMADSEGVPETERDAIVRGFLSGLRAPRTAAEVDPQAALSDTTGAEDGRGGHCGALAPPPLQALSGRELVPLLKNEHPQTLAVIIPRLEPTQAAELLEGLPTDIQTEVVRRILQLENPDPDAITIIADELSSQYEREQTARERLKAGCRTVEAILQAARRDCRAELLGVISRSNAQLGASLAQAAAGAAQSCPSGGIDLSDPRAAAGAFEQLAETEPAMLASVLLNLPRDIAVLALAGSSRACRSAILSQLPTMSALQLRDMLDNPHPIRLGDIHSAQARIVQAARQMPYSQAVPARVTLQA
jgi:flagellar motor switch protein FliG